MHLREVNTDISDYNGIGADFRAARVRNGESLESVADGLRIRLEHLQAIEEGRFDALPAPVYAVGFVRSFAEHVGIDGADAIARFKAEAEGLSAQTRLSFPTPEEESRVPKGWLLVLAGVAAVMIYAGWYYVENKDRLNLASVQQVPERLAGRSGQPTEKAVVTPAVQAPEPAVPATTEVKPAALPVEPVESATVIGAPEPVTATPAPVVLPVYTPAPYVPPAQPEPATVAAVSAAPAAVEAEAPASGQSGQEDEETASETATSDGVADVATQPAEESATATPQTVASEEEPAVTAQPAEPAAEPVDQPAAVRPKPVVQPLPTPEERALLASATTTPGQPEAAAEAATATTAQIEAATEADTPVVAAPQAEEPAAPETENEAATAVPTAPAAPAIPQAPVASNETPTAVAAASSQRINEPQVFGVGNWNARVVLTARADVWVQVSTADGRALLSRILRQGDKYLVPSKGEVLLTTGNAGALAISVDGKNVPPIGPAGAVRREVVLSPESLLATAATGN